VQRRVSSVRMKDRDNLALRLPIGDIVHDEPKVKDSSRQIAFERQRCDAEYILDLCQFDGDIDVKRFFLRFFLYSHRVLS